MRGAKRGAAALGLEQAYRTNQAIHGALSTAAVHAWLIVVVIALVAPHLLFSGVVFAVPYTASMPFAFRSVERGLTSRMVGSDDMAGDGFGRRR